jgi:hypothetical protein
MSREAVQSSTIEHTVVPLAPNVSRTMPSRIVTKFPFLSSSNQGAPNSIQAKTVRANVCTDL